jgi:hypothetical protein
LRGVSVSPCCRSHPASVVRRVRQSATAHAAFALPVAGSASGAAHLRGHLGVRLRYRLETRHHPADDGVERLQEVGFPSPCSPSSRALAFPLVGLPPTEHASLSWTHTRTCSRVGRQRVASMGTFPTAPLRTPRESFDLTGLASDLCRDLCALRLVHYESPRGTFGSSRMTPKTVSAFRISRTSPVGRQITCPPLPCTRRYRAPWAVVTPPTTMGTPSP